MKFSDAIEEIKNRLSIVNVISEYVKLERKGSSYVGICPFHADKNPSFSVNEPRKMYKCFACGKGGNIYTFLQEYLQITFREAVLMLAKKANIEIEDDFSSNESFKKNAEKKNKLYELYRDAANIYYKILFSDIGKAGLNYLISRKLTKETIKKFGLGFAPNDFGYIYNLMKKKGYDDTLLFESKLFRLYNGKPCDTFYNRVMFPLVDTYKHVIGFQSRTLDPKPKERKYVNSDDSLIFHKKSFLYAMNLAYFSKENYYILCEGNMDAITIHQAGFDSAVATMGTAFNEQQMFLLKRKPKKVYLCQDTDEAGVKAIISSDKILKKSGIETYVIDIKPSKDVDEYINNYGVDSFKAKLNNPIPTFLFIISTLKNKYNISDPYELEKYINEIVDRLTEISNTFVRDSYLKKIALQENLDLGILHSLLEKKLKGNKVVYNNETANQNQNISLNNNINKSKISKVDSDFIQLIYLLPEYKNHILSIVSSDELYDDIYKCLYKFYENGVSMSSIYNKIIDRDEDEKQIINTILSYNLSFDEDDKQQILNSLNQVIRKIKIRNAENDTDGSIESIYELNKKIIDINKTIYIK